MASSARSNLIEVCGWRRLLCGWAAVLTAALPSFAQMPIPASRRVQASVVGTLAAPKDQAMHMPTDVAIDRRGRVVVADGALDRLMLFRPDGSFEGPLTAVGDMALNRPVGVHVDAQDRLWIADSGNHRLLVAGPEGKLLERIELPAPDGGRPFEPTDVAVTADGRRAYIADNDNHRLAVRDNASGKLEFLGRFGEGLGQFRWPFMIALAPDGYAYVTEAIGARAQRLSPTDRWAGQLGRWGVELGQLYRPKGVAVDTRGRVYIGDSTMGVIQVFGARGGIEGVLTDSAGQPLRLEHPMGMAFAPGGRLYVVELTANRVAMISLPTGYADTQPASAPAPEGGRP